MPITRKHDGNFLDTYPEVVRLLGTALSVLSPVVGQGNLPSLQPHSLVEPAGAFMRDTFHRDNDVRSIRYAPTLYLLGRNHADD